MKTAIAILTLTILTLSCKDNGKTVTTENTQIIGQDSLTNTQTKNSRQGINLIHETENLKLYGDTTIDKDKISYALVKFEPYIGFDDFEINAIDHKKYADLDLKSNKGASNFRTRLREGFSADTANFAGHYSFVYWGCGSPCQSSLLIDRKTGKVYDSPSASVGYDFRVNSRMLIVNPPDTSGFFMTTVFTANL
ncbi:hypothetical protein [Niabella ginsengisoli]|uniref:Uncharacterized protein n=1 Tax=Niabella ginsengisoli TaxID=522298 RepID=A0ABS9SJU1_9BACT|nr:hypothetical protein [Niabella ginsengisoli]MCH5598634.1 hypothetical protein [Niabella ginsengisoli]